MPIFSRHSFVGFYFHWSHMSLLVRDIFLADFHLFTRAIFNKLHQAVA